MYAANIFGEPDNNQLVVIPKKLNFTYFESDKLTKEENELANAMDNILYWFFHNKKSFAIQGSAGTGKTTLIREIIKSSYKEKIYLCAPTHKAVEQFGKLSELLNEKQYQMNKIEMGTLQKGLGLRVDVDEKGDYVYEITGQGELFKNHYSYVIVDEASMVSKEQYYTLMGLGIPVLFIGDKNQLPPVAKEPFSIYDFFKESEIYHIREKKRFKSERFKELVQNVETAIRDNASFDKKLLDWVIEYNDVLKGILKLPENIPVHYIDYTNKGGLYYWLSKHGHYYIKDKVYYAKGESKVVSKSRKYTLKQILKEHHVKHKGQEIKVKQVVFTDDQSEDHTLWVYNPNEEGIIIELKRKIRLMGKKFEGTMDMFADLTPICKEELDLSVEDYIILKNAVMLYPDEVYTVHASQGSTFENTLINIGSFRYIKNEANLEKLKLFYVAVSRARECVYYKV